jgi:hypothetical protein
MARCHASIGVTVKATCMCTQAVMPTRGTPSGGSLPRNEKGSAVREISRRKNVNAERGAAVKRASRHRICEGPNGDERKDTRQTFSTSR